jgi:hypothetical protein
VSVLLRSALAFRRELFKEPARSKPPNTEKVPRKVEIGCKPEDALRLTRRLPDKTLRIDFASFLDIELIRKGEFYRQPFELGLDPLVLLVAQNTLNSAMAPRDRRRPTRS